MRVLYRPEKSLPKNGKPELSELLPLSACKGMSSELRLVCLDNLLAEMLTMKKGRLTMKKERITTRKEMLTTKKKKDRPKGLSNISWILPEQ